jgi:hypothetical protein
MILSSTHITAHPTARADTTRDTRGTRSIQDAHTTTYTNTTHSTNPVDKLPIPCIRSVNISLLTGKDNRKTTSPQKTSASSHKHSHRGHAGFMVGIQTFAPTFHRPYNYYLYYYINY